jgi:hypothetical protein
MIRKTIVMALIIAVMSTAGYAEPVDNSSPSQEKEESALAGGTSYFEGVWVGAWEFGVGSMSGSSRQDVTIAVDKKNKKGLYKTTYSWGWAKSGTGGNIPPGSFNVYGREQDGAFIFWWKDREGNKRTVKLEKQKDDVVKGRIEREGPSTPINPSGSRVAQQTF